VEVCCFISLSLGLSLQQRDIFIEVSQHTRSFLNSSLILIILSANLMIILRCTEVLSVYVSLEFSIIGCYQQDTFARVIVSIFTPKHKEILDALRQHVLQLTNGSGSLLVHE
jgi:hypothetical protein